MADNHVIKYEETVRKLNSTFDSHIGTIGRVVDEYVKLNKEFTKIPSEYIDRLEKMTQLNKELELSETKLIKQQIEAENLKRKKAQRESAEILRKQREIRLNNQAETQEARKAKAQEREAARLARVNNAYNQANEALKRLSAQYNHLATRKQLGEKLTNKELADLKRLRKEVLMYQNALKKVDAQRGVFNRNVGNYGSALAGFGTQAMGALGWGGMAYSVAELGRKAYTTTRELDTLRNSMFYGSASAEDYASNIEFLDRVTEDYGLELLSTSTAFNKFYVASKDKLDLEEIQVIFDKVSKSAAVMGLSISDQEGIFRALEQMMSKGTIQSEELRMQLGDRIPVAMQAMAKAVGVGERQLMKMMKDGELMSAEILPKFAVEIEKAMGADTVKTIDTLSASQNRMKNAWTNLMEDIEDGSGVISNASKGFNNMVTGILNAIGAKKSLTNEIEKETDELNLLVSQIVTTNDNEKKRLELIEKLKSTYPDFISMIGSEDLTNQNLIDTLKLVNNEYKERIRLQLMAEKAEKTRASRDASAVYEETAKQRLYSILNEYNKEAEDQVLLTYDNAIELGKKALNKEADFTLSGLDWLDVSEYIKQIEQYGGEAEKLTEKLNGQTKEIEKQSKESGVLTEEERARNKELERRNIIFSEYYEQAKKLGGVPGVDFDITTAKSFVQSKQGGGNKPKGKATKSAAKDYTKDRIKAQYELQKAILETASMTYQLDGLTDEYYTNEQKLALLNKNHKLLMLELEVNDKETANIQKLVIEEEYNQEIAKLNESEKKDFDKTEQDKLKSQEEYNKMRLEQMEKLQESIKKVIQENLDSKIFKLEMEALDFDADSIEQFRIEIEKLDAQLAAGAISDNEHALALKKIKTELKDLFREYVKGFSSLEQFGMGSLDQFFNGEFEKILDGADGFAEKFAAVFIGVTEVVQEAFALMEESSNAYYEKELSNLETEKEVALRYAEDIPEAKQHIEEQYEAKRAEIKRRQAEQEKQYAIFNSIINTAQGITSALAQANIPLAIIIGAMGAVQTGLIASQPLPEFWQGTDNAPEGWAIVDEKRPEVHTDKHGNIKSFGSKKGANFRYLEKGDKIIPSHQEFFEQMGDGRSFNTVIEGYSQIDYNRMEAIMDKTVGRIQLEQTSIDEAGFNRYTVKGNNRTKRKNNRIKKS